MKHAKWFGQIRVDVYVVDVNRLRPARRAEVHTALIWRARGGRLALCGARLGQRFVDHGRVGVLLLLDLRGGTLHSIARFFRTLPLCAFGVSVDDVSEQLPRPGGLRCRVVFARFILFFAKRKHELAVFGTHTIVQAVLVFLGKLARRFCPGALGCKLLVRLGKDTGHIRRDGLRRVINLNLVFLFFQPFRIGFRRFRLGSQRLILFGCLFFQRQIFFLYFFYVLFLWHKLGLVARFDRLL